MKKKLLSSLFIGTLAFSLAGCASDGAETTNQEGATEAEGGNEELSFNPGSYVGTADGYNGPIELEVTFDEEAITDIKIVSQSETEHVGDVAYDIMFKDMLAANGSGVDLVTGATITSAAVRTAVNDAAEQGEVSDDSIFKKNTVEHEPQDPIEETYDVVVVGGGGAGMMAAAQAAQNGDSVIVLEKAAEVGGNTLVSGGQFQSAMPYLVWDAENPDATTGEYDGETYDKVKSDSGRLDTLRTIVDWNEEPFDGTISEEQPFEPGDVSLLAPRGVHEEYLDTLLELKDEIRAYLDWADPQLKAGTHETELTLFSTPNLHIFQTYYGGLRANADEIEWEYGSHDLVRQVIEGGQELKPWLEDMGASFDDASQITLVGGLWQRQNNFIGSTIDGVEEEGRWATYFRTALNELEVNNEDNQVMNRTTAEHLIVDDSGRVTGVTGKRYDGTEVTIQANKGVILATGGYAANTEMVAEANEYWEEGSLATDNRTTNRHTMQGDGIVMAEEAGADLTGMGYTQLMPLSWIQDGNLSFGGGENVIYLNPTTGERYVNESAERDVLSKAALENGIEVNGVPGVYIEVAHPETAIPGPYPYQDEDVEWRQYIRDLAGAEELLKELGFDITAEQLEETITAYDEYVMSDGGTDLEIEKTGFRNIIGEAEQDENGNYLPDTYEIGEIRIRFMAPAPHHTMGGIAVDEGRRALDGTGQPIPGLYAAGEVSGGIHGGNRLGGNALTEIFVSGRTAANSIAEDAE